MLIALNPSNRLNFPNDVEWETTFVLKMDVCWIYLHFEPSRCEFDVGINDKIAILDPHFPASNMGIIIAIWVTTAHTVVFYFSCTLEMYIVYYRDI
jgi:hypothetical protein